MVDAGSARCVLGNHEFNAIAWATPDPDHEGKFLRDHHKPGNREQHQAFLNVVERTHLQKEITDWFKTLPLWLDLDLRQDVATDEVRKASWARAPNSPCRARAWSPNGSTDKEHRVAVGIYRGRSRRVCPLAVSERRQALQVRSAAFDGADRSRAASASRHTIKEYEELLGLDSRRGRKS